jgi:predicted GNAT family acetyltransferase
VVEDAGEVVGAACWTRPHKVVVSPMTDEAARVVGRHVAGLGLPVPGVVGLPGPARAAADSVADETGATVSVRMHERLLVLGDYRAPEHRVDGSARLATDDDHALVVAWLDQFQLDAGLLRLNNEAVAWSNRGRLWLWEVDGTPVAMAGHAPVVETPVARVGRVGPVYTPASWRGHGYGSAVTAVVTEHLLDQCDTVMLYTDAANSTSNALYERLGYRHTEDLVELSLTAPGDA